MSLSSGSESASFGGARDVGSSGCPACRPPTPRPAGFASRLGRRVGLLAATLAAFGAGCQEKPAGPRRADHKAAHSARYHPDIRRSPATAPEESAPPLDEALDPESLLASRPAGGEGVSPVMFVNGHVLSVQDVLEPILGELIRASRTLGPQGYQRLLAERVTQQIQMQINTLLIYHDAKKSFPEKANEVLDKEVDKELQSYINAEFGGVRTRFEARLRELGMTEADVKERIRRQIMVAQFQHQKFKPLLREPPRRELQRYYESRIDQFSTPEKAELFLIEIPLAEILGKPPGQANAAELDRAREQAREQLAAAAAELAGGADFQVVARRYSRGAKASAGGAWGEITPGSLTRRWARVDEVLFTLPPGGTSDIIETAEALFIVRCGRRTPARRQTFEEAQEAIIERLKDEQYAQLTSDYIRSLRRAAVVDKLPEFARAVALAAPRHIPRPAGAEPHTAETPPPR